jgi:hypothetical protein
MKTYRIQDREAGNVIETGLKLSEAEKILQEFEDNDKNEGNYTPNFYEIKEDDNDDERKSLKVPATDKNLNKIK